jgi:hypothetical protein
LVGIIVLCTVRDSYGINYGWDNGGGDNLWTTTANWSPNGTPASDSYCYIDLVGDGNQPIINSDMTINVHDFWIGWSTAGEVLMDMTGGSLTVENVYLGMATNSDGIFDMTGGSASITGQMGIGSLGQGTVNISGESTSVDCNELRIPNNVGPGELILYDGTFEVDDLTFDPLSNSLGHEIDIREGTLILDGNMVSEVASWEDTEIVAYNGATYAYLIYDYDVTNAGKTTVTATPGSVGWANNASDNLWRNKTNWNPQVCPSSLDSMTTDKTGSDQPIIDSSTTAYAKDTWIGYTSAGDVTLEMTGGTLTTEDMYLEPIRISLNTET